MQYEVKGLRCGQVLTSQCFATGSLTGFNFGES